MNTELERLIESVVKDLRSKDPDILLDQNLLDMIDAISLLSNSGMKATKYFVSLMRAPRLLITPSKGSTYAG